MNSIKKISLFAIILLLAIAPVLAISANLTFVNGTQPEQLFYDRAGTIINGSTYGSDSYMDHSYTTKNLYIDICHQNLAIGQQIDLVYSSYSNLLLSSTLNYRPQVHEIEIRNVTGGGTIKCAVMDVALAARKTLFPGYLTPLLIPENSTYDWSDYNASTVIEYEQLPILLNGSYEVGIEVEGPPKVYYITPVKAYDHLEQEITQNSQQLLMSFLSANNTTLNEERLAVGESMIQTQDIVGGETVYINDILSLEIQVYDPCTPINGSGYYIMNGSVYNQNKTCIVVNDSTELVINFGDEIITGDGSENGSKAPEECAVLIQNSKDITLENLKTSNYYYGVCIENSSVTVYGTGTSENFRGARVDSNSTVDFVDITFTNDESEIIAQNDSIVNLYSVDVSTAQLKSTFKNAIVKGVNDLPEPLGLSGLVDIEQFVEYTNNSDDSYAQISFHYEEPLPNNVVTDNISIYKYTRGIPYNTTIEMVNQTFNATLNTTVNVTYNVTVENVTDGNWTKIYTIVSPSEQLIISPNMTSFSIYAPYGEEAPPNPDPVPDPTPRPDPVPESGGSSGSGGTPSSPDFDDSGKAVAEPVILELIVPENISLMQGETGEIEFAINNIGEGNSGNLVVGPQARRGWDVSNISVDSLGPGASFDGSVLIAPYEKELPGDYLVPVTIYMYNDNGTLVKFLSEIVRVEVTPRAALKRIKIVEYPPEILYRPYSEVDVVFLAENIGDFDLNEIEPVIEDTSCVRKIVSKPTTVKKGDLEELEYTVLFAGGDSCYTHIKFFSEDELVGFLPIHFEAEGKVPSLEFPQVRGYKQVLWMIIFVIWTGLTVLVVERRRKRL